MKKEKVTIMGKKGGSKRIKADKKLMKKVGKQFKDGIDEINAGLVE